jgi:F-type H+-transporting ATPase subunit a
MVFSNKPVQFLLVALVAAVFLYFGFANPAVDSISAVNEAVAEHVRIMLHPRKNSMHRINQ